MLRIVAVSYINTWPFIFGIRNSGFFNNFHLNLAVPSLCAKLFGDGEADIALVPVGALPTLTHYEIIDNFGIASNGYVKSVIIVANNPIEEIQTIYTDSDSLSSAKLVKILAKQHWKKEFKIPSINLKTLNNLKPNEAMMLIGDKALFLEQQYSFHYDLAKIWKDYCGLPFVFAVWIKKNNINDSQLQHFTEAIAYGIKNIPLALQQNNTQNYNFELLFDYLTNNIILKYDNKAKEGMDLYLSLLKELN